MAINFLFDILAPIYDRIISQPDPGVLRELLDIPEDGLVLDAGGGTGRVSSQLLPFVNKLILSDLSFPMLKEAQGKGISCLVQGTSGQFQDKPWIGTDKNNRVYIIYSIFLGEINNNIHSKIMISRSLDGGDTWMKPSKISEGQQKNQGTTIAIDQNNDTIYVAWRRFKSVNETDAILIVKSEDFGATFVKAEIAADIAFPFDQPTMGSQFGASQFRTNSYPTMAVDDSGRVYLAWTQRISKLGDARLFITSRARGDWGTS